MKFFFKKNKFFFCIGILAPHSEKERKKRTMITVQVSASHGPQVAETPFCLFVFLCTAAPCLQAAEAEAKEAKRKMKEEKKRQADERACVRAEAWNTMKAKEREAAYYARLRTPPPPDEDDEEWEPDFPRARVAEFEFEAGRASRTRGAGGRWMR